MITLFINFWLLSPWLIWNSYLLYFTLVDDKNFQFVITSKKQLWSYWLYLLIFLFFGIYIFLVRLSRITVAINVYRILEISQGIIKSLSYWSILGLGIFSLFLLIFWMLLLRQLYAYLRKCLYSLYLYYYQYGEFRKLIYLHNTAHSNFTRFLVRRVKIFTRNENIIANTLTLWPYSILVVERNFFRYLLPYMLIFDMFTEYGEIFHMFSVLPWYYIYGLLRSTSKLLTKFFIAKDLSFIEAVYGLK